MATRNSPAGTDAAEVPVRSLQPRIFFLVYLLAAYMCRLHLSCPILVAAAEEESPRAPDNIFSNYFGRAPDALAGNKHEDNM